MTFKERFTCLSVHIQNVDLNDIVDLVLLLGSLILGRSNGSLEEISVPVERELVHRVNLVQVV